MADSAPTTTPEQVLDLLGRYSGVGIWDAVIVDGDPLGAATQWTWSEEYRRLLGYTDTASFPNVLASWYDAIHPDERDGIVAAIAVAAAPASRQDRFEATLRQRCHDGAYRWFKIIGGIFRDPDGVPTRACGSLIDVDEVEQARIHASSYAQMEIDRLETINRRIKSISLNAMIEATRAGAAGMAFGAVAQEIRALSNEISLLAGRIRDDIGKR